jgi:hypothetical protein
MNSPAVRDATYGQKGGLRPQMSNFSSRFAGPLPKWTRRHTYARTDARDQPKRRTSTFITRRHGGSDSRSQAPDMMDVEA